MKKHLKMHCGKTGLDEMLLLFIIPIMILTALIASALHLRKVRKEAPAILRVAALSKEIDKSADMIIQSRASRGPLTEVERMLPVRTVKAASTNTRKGETDDDTTTKPKTVSVFKGVNLYVTAIVADGQNQVAVINGEVVAVGKEVAPGVTLAAVGNGKAVFRGPEGKLKEVEVFEDENSKQEDTFN